MNLRSLFCAALLALPLPLMAQETATPVTNGQKFGAWTVNCAETGTGQNRCLLGQQVLRTEDRSLVAQMLAFRSPNGQTFLSARVPVGVFLPAGFAIRLEEGGEIHQFTWQVCDGQVCEAVWETTAEELTPLVEGGKPILAGYQPGIQAERVLFRVSFDGLLDGLNALTGAN